jgi:hypothetical protein
MTYSAKPNCKHYAECGGCLHKDNRGVLSFIGLHKTCELIKYQNNGCSLQKHKYEEVNGMPRNVPLGGTGAITEVEKRALDQLS